jgi:hypothetical protein
MAGEAYFVEDLQSAGDLRCFQVTLTSGEDSSGTHFDGMMLDVQQVSEETAACLTTTMTEWCNRLPTERLFCHWRPGDRRPK